MHPQRANIPLQGLDRRVLTVRGISGPHCQIAALHWCISPVVDLHGRKKHSGEADQLTLTSGGSEHAELFSVAISWGNKINFCCMHTWLVFAQMVTCAKCIHGNRFNLVFSF